MKRVTPGVTLSLLMFISQAPARVIAAPVIVVGNNPVTVFAEAQRCEPLDLPDAPLRAFRRPDGMVVAFATHYLNRALVGPSLSHLSHDCKLVYQGKHLADPAQFDDRTWITATWTFDGMTVSALGHNEYHADQFPGQCQFKTYMECWYNAIVPLSSLDGGRSFTRTHYPTTIAAPPMKSDENQGRPRGYLNPSNIIFHSGYYYTLIGRSAFGGKKAGRCLFRTENVLSPETWKVWDGDSYISIIGSPYEAGWTEKPTCEAATGLGGALGSIAKINGSKLFAAFWIAESSNNIEGGYVNVSFSEDLLHWFGTQHLLNVTPSWSSNCPQGVRYNYPSALSDFDKGKNFESLGVSSWLFLTRTSCSHSLDWDLVRFALTLNMAGESGTEDIRPEDH
jgi:hypothetical protein